MTPQIEVPAADEPPRGEGTAILPSLRSLVAEIARFSGAAGIRTAAWVVLGALVEGVGLMLLVPLLALVVAADGGGGRLGRLVDDLVWPHLPAMTAQGRLVFLLAMFAGLMVVRAVVIIMRDRSLALLQTGFVRDIRVRLMRALASAPWDVVARLRHGRVTHVLGPDLESSGLAVHFILQVGVALLMLAVQIGLLTVLISPALAAVTIGFLGLAVLLARPVLRSARELGAKVSEAHLTVAHDTGQFLGGLKVAVSQNLQGDFLQRFDSALGSLAEQQVRFAGERTRAQVVLTGLSASIAGFALLFGTVVLGLPAASLIAVLLVLARMTGPAGVIQQGAQYIVHSLPALEQVRALETELLALDPPAQLGTAQRTVGSDIVFDDVSLVRGTEGSTGNARRVLANIEVTIPAGLFLGIRGSSGAGKTSFVDLLVGLFPPTAGQVRVGGQALVGPVVQGWRDRISYVSQDPFLFHQSIRENLLWASRGASEEDMWAALALAGADAFTRGFASGLDTVVGERGMLMSGGERQRIALARALVRKPVLLVLDEATNAIDIPAESRILRRLADLTPRPTIVMVAHREESLALCEQVLHFANGTLEHGYEAQAGHGSG